MTYDEALDYIASLAQRGWRMGLDRMSAFADSAGLLGGPKFIHVAGTNGKGSVTAYLQSILVESGYQTGAFFSPYVLDIRERIQLGRELISKHDFARLATELQPDAERFSETEYGGITEFEFKTAMGFRYWQETNCEWVALEVGLGGRLDSTNIVTPDASVIVSIGLDHTAILGETYAEIAFEKAGVIKTGVPAIVGQVNQESMAVIKACAEEVNAPLWRIGHEIAFEQTSKGVSVSTPVRTHTSLVPGLVGSMQAHNLALAVAAIDASGAFRNEHGIQLGAKNAFAPGRFQVVARDGQTYLLDGAHNLEAIEVLIESVKVEFPRAKIATVVGMVSGHEPSMMLKKLDELSEDIVLTPIQFHRAVSPVELSQYVPRAQVAANVGEALALAQASQPDLILITGSFYLVGEVGRLLLASQP